MNYIEWERNRWRRGGIIAGVVVFHIVVITTVARWHGWIPTPVERLIEVNIYADDPPGPAAAAKPHGGPAPLMHRFSR